MNQDAARDRCGCQGRCDQNQLSRREIVKLAGLGAAAMLAPDLPVMAGPFVDAEFARLIPADKKLRPEWVKSLFERGRPEVYSGEELRFIGMPVGGMFCGTVYLGGDGRLWLWDIFNKNQLGVVARNVPFAGGTLDPICGANYVAPLAATDHRVLEQGFTLTFETPAGRQSRPLSADGFKDVRFTGQYPIGTVQYADPGAPVRVTMEAFSPFIPLNDEDSSLPVTVLSFSLENTATEPLPIELTGLLEYAACRAPTRWTGRRCVDVVSTDGLTLAKLSVQPATDNREPRPEIVFEDWSKDDYAGWTVQGMAFGKGPVNRKDMPGYQGDVGGDTQRVVNSHAGAPGGGIEEKDRAVGKLTSRPFVIARRYISFWIGGGDYAGKTCLNLLIDGKPIRSATGHNDNRMSPSFFDVSEFEGRSAVLEIVDDETGPWGNIGVGRISFGDLPAGAVPPERQPDFGSMCLALLGAPAETLSRNQAVPLSEKLTALLGRWLTLQPGRKTEINFLIAWHFPNVGIRPDGRRHYTERFANAAEVAEYVARNFNRLTGQTRLWRDTWYDSTLPHWFLNRTFANTSILATTTCHRFSDGRFWAWEGVGCCQGTCTHVWHYAQALARLFPQIERDQRRRVDFGLALAADGVIGYRAEDDRSFAADGQAGRILGVYREHQMSVDGEFLKGLWPKVKLALQRLMQADPKGDGLVLGPLPNTLDASWFGTVPWLCGLYQAAVRAGEQMAIETGDTEFAARCRAILDKAPAALDAACWKDDYGYYVHHGDPAHPEIVGAYDGCHIDQVFGQHWAWQTGLGPVMNPAHVKAALKSLWTYNFSPDVGPFRAKQRAGRWYALAGEGGLIMVTFPFGSGRTFSGAGAGTSLYFNECMSGFEHQAAGHMLWEGLTLEGLAVTRAIHDRYHARLRNPYNEVECSDHYARAMASYGTYLAACGFECHGPKAHLGFAPRISPENFRAAFTTAEGWGSFSQTIAPGTQQATIKLASGRLRLRTLTLTAGPNIKPRGLTVKLAGQTLPASLATIDGRIKVLMDSDVVIDPGQSLEINISC